MSKATPGPWVRRGESVNAHRPHAVSGYNEESVLALTRSPEERTANAALIAAAPELRDALRAMLETFDCGCASITTCDHPTIKRAWNALAKSGS